MPPGSGNADKLRVSTECLNHKGLEPVSLSTRDRQSYFYVNGSKLKRFYIFLIFRDAKAWQCGTERGPSAHTLQDGLHPGSCPTVGIMSVPTAPQVSRMPLQRNAGLQNRLPYL